MIRPLNEASAQHRAPTESAEEMVNAALAIVRDTACRGLTVVQLAEAIGKSRSALEKAFRRNLGTSPHTEILRFRIGRAKRLLIDTSHVVREVAVMAGFSQVAYFVVRFKQDTGYTPGAFRKKYRRPELKQPADGEGSMMVLRFGRDPAGMDGVDRAKRLLLDTSFDIGEIAGMAGFSRTAYFVVKFKKQTGYTPGFYRKAFRFSDATDGGPESRSDTPLTRFRPGQGLAVRDTTE